MLTGVEMALVVLAAVGAGAINAVVGSGTLITFPTLVLFGVPPVTANMSNTLGLVPGGLTAAHGYRAELRGHGPTVRLLLPASAVGGVVGASLLVLLPARAFEVIVPALIGLGIALVLIGPRLRARAERRRGGPVESVRHPWRLRAGVGAAGVYGGYFGAAQGVILIGLLSSLLPAPLQTINGIKNVLATLANLVSAATFLLVARDQVDWTLVVLIAVGSTLGGALGARVGRGVPPSVLRGIVVVVGVAAILRLLWA